MLRMKEMVGKSILDVETGQRLGRVEDLVLDGARGRVEAVVVGVDWRSWFGVGRVLPFEAVHAVGQHAVIARGGVELLPMSEWSQARDSVHFSSTDLEGKPVLTADGIRIGIVNDAVVDAGTGRLAQLEVTAGTGRSLRPRRSMLPVTPGVRIGDHMVIVPAAREEEAGERPDPGRPGELP